MDAFRCGTELVQDQNESRLEFTMEESSGRLPGLSGGGELQSEERCVLVGGSFMCCLHEKHLKYRQTGLVGVRRGSSYPDRLSVDIGVPDRVSFTVPL